MNTYTLCFELVFCLLMSLSAAIALNISILNRKYSFFVTFMGLFVTKLGSKLFQFYMEKNSITLVATVMYIFFVLSFDFLFLFLLFDSSFQEKFVVVFSSDVLAFPILIVRNIVEKRNFINGVDEANKMYGNYMITEASELILDIFIMLCSVVLACLLVFLFSKLLKKINYNSRIMNIFGFIALIVYFILEGIAFINYSGSFIIDGISYFVYYAITSLFWIAVIAVILYFGTGLEKKRLDRRLEAVNKEKERQFEYYENVKKHNLEIRKLRHDIKGHFNVLGFFAEEDEYEKIEEYIKNVKKQYDMENITPSAEANETEAIK